MKKAFTLIDERMPYVKYLGFSFWLAWFGASYGSAVWIQHSSENSAVISSMFNASTMAHLVALILAAVFSRRVGVALRSNATIFGAGFVTTLGCLCIVAAAPSLLRSEPLFLAGSVLTGVGTAAFALHAGLLLCALRPGKACNVLLFAQIVGVFLQFMILGLPSSAALAMFVVLPLLSSLCFAIGSARKQPDAVRESSRLSPNPKFALLLVAIFILSVTSNVSRGVYNASATPFQLADDGALVNLVVVVAICAMAFVTALSQRSLNVGHWFYPAAVAIIAALLVAYLLPESGSFGFVVTGAAYQMLDIIMWYVFSYVVYQSKMSAVFVVASGRAAISGGVTAGSLVGSLFLHPDAMLGDVSAAVVYAVLFVASLMVFLVLPERQIQCLLMPIPDEDEERLDGKDVVVGEAAKANAAFDPAVSSSDAHGPSAAVNSVAPFRMRVQQLASEYGLTEREHEVFMLLAHGRGSQSISDALTISLYTTRAHTRNIYAKLGVHSRQELIDMVDGRAAMP